MDLATRAIFIIAAPRPCFPGGDTDNCSVCKGKIWIYPFTSVHL